MSTRDIVLRAAFWHDASVRSLSAACQLELLKVYSHTDRDGITRLDYNGFQPKLLRELNERGHIVVYDNDDHKLIWVTRYGEQPSRGQFSGASYNLPAPSKMQVTDALRRLYGKEPTKDEAKRHSPRTFKMRKRTASGPSSDDVTRIWGTWRKFQKAPERCHLGAGAQRVINSALRETTTDVICEFIEYAYTADDAGPRYWRGENQQQRTYLGLDNLLRVTRLSGRVEAMRNWKSRNSEVKSGALSTLGPMAAYRRRNADESDK